jgi:hypothetical protein
MPKAGELWLAEIPFTISHSQGDARLVEAAWSQHAQLRFNL